MSRMQEIIEEALAQNGADAAAVAHALERSSGGVDHVLRSDRRGEWVMRHPLHERWGYESLMTCPFNDLVGAPAASGAFGRGLEHRLWIDRGGVLCWEEIGANPA